jgi:hypothetical protein
MTTIGHVLKQEIESYSRILMQSNPLFLAAQRGALRPEHVRAYVGGLLVLIRGTIPLMRRAEARAEAIGDDALAAHWRRKITEEIGHDRWGESDLGRLAPGSGGRASDGVGGALRELLGYLEETIDRDPCLLLAYALLAEYLTVLVGGHWLQALERHCGIPQRNVSVIANHVELDVAHATEGVVEIDRLRTDRTNPAAMLDVLRTALGYYEAFWRDVSAAQVEAA